MSAQQSPATTPDSMIGCKIGHYTIRKRIGQGGMGVVYEAVHDKIQQRVAIKVLHKEMSQDEKVVQRFFNEANAISMAQHSSIVKIMDYGQLDGGPAYIMMEFLEGEPLLTRIERAQDKGTALGLQMVIEICRQTATALSLIHEKNIVHRDLKPENIFVVPDSVAPLGERVKLLDFGIAKFLDGPVRKTTVGMILGTPLYMSPEQCEGREDLNAKVDVYALGAMMYEMVAGRLPFQADTAAALMRQHMFKPAPRLREHAPTAPQGLDDLIAEMLRKDPVERPSMSEIVRRLEQILPSVSGKTAPLVEGVRVPRVPRRTGVGEDQALDPLAATVGDVSRSGRTAKEQRVPSGSQSSSALGTQPEMEHRRIQTPILIGAIAVLLVGLLVAIFVIPTRTAETRKPAQQPANPTLTTKAAEPGTAPHTPPEAPTTDAGKSKSAVAEAVATESSDAEKGGKAGRKKGTKVGKVGKAGPADKTDKTAEVVKAEPAEKSNKPAGKAGKDSSASDIGVWRDP